MNILFIWQKCDCKFFSCCNYSKCSCHNQGSGFCGFFRICGFFFQCFQYSAFLRIYAVSSFPHSNQRERNAEKIAYKITLTEPQTEIGKMAHKNIHNRASAPWTSELWASCAVHTFILLTSGVLNGNNLLWRMRFLHRCYYLLEVGR